MSVRWSRCTPTSAAAASGTPFAETDEDRAVNADAQTDHARETGHRQFWHYTVQRGQSRLYFV
jgi:hypothetical protein